jgi:hypothetical protein
VSVSSTADKALRCSAAGTARFARAAVIARPFAEGALVLAFFWRYNALDDDFAVRRHHEIHGFGLDHFQRFAEKSAGDLQFLADAGLLGDGGHIQRRMVADSESHFHWLIVVFILRTNVVAMIGGVDHESELTLTLLLVPVYSHVHRIGAALLADQRSSIDIRAGVSLIDGQHGQKIEVGIVPL